MGERFEGGMEIFLFEDGKVGTDRKTKYNFDALYEDKPSQQKKIF